MKPKLPKKNDKISNKNESKINSKIIKNKKAAKTNINSKLNYNKYGYDIYDPKNAQKFNKEFLGLNSGNSNGMYVGEGIFNMDLPMHKPGEVPDFSNPYGNNFFNNKGNNKLNPRTQPLEYLQNFFGGFGIEFPVKDIMNPNNNINNINKKNIHKNNKNISAPKSIKTNKNSNFNYKNEQRKININRHEFDKSLFNNNYIMNNEDLFTENYCSNFRSNLEKEAFDYLVSLIKGNRVLPSQQKQTPIKIDIFKKLNKFEMNEKYMKKNGDILENPFCCICLANMILKQKCVLLPCGHLFHYKCVQLWLQKNSVCPMCRFDLNEYFSNLQK